MIRSAVRLTVEARYRYLVSWLQSNGLMYEPFDEESLAGLSDSDLDFVVKQLNDLARCRVKSKSGLLG